jgi:hypothetical protein
VRADSYVLSLFSRANPGGIENLGPRLAGTVV